MTICRKCKNDGKITAFGLCRKCYAKKYNTRPEVKERTKKYHREYYARPEVKERQRERNKEYNGRPDVKDKRMENEVCSILKKHHTDMKDDPESLSTEFMQEMIGIKCDK